MGAHVRGARVLAVVVEDEPVLARTYARALRRAGSEVRVAGSADEMFEMVPQEEWGRIDVAILDVGLPGEMHGHQLAAVVRARNPRAEIALVSGAVPQEQVRAAVVELNVSFMPKPLSEGELSRWAAGVCARAPARLLETEITRLADAHRLTEAEVAVLRQAASTSEEHKEIAAALDIEIETVRSHVKSILRKTRSRSLRDLARTLARRLR